MESGHVYFSTLPTNVKADYMKKEDANNQTLLLK